MNRKVLLTLAVIVAIVGYLAFKPASKQSLSTSDTATSTKKEDTSTRQAAGQESSAPALVDTKVRSETVTQPEATETSEKPAPTPVDQTTQESLVDTLKADTELAKVASVSSVECVDGKCTVELEAKDNQNIQMKMLSFMAQHRDEYGRYSKFDEDKDNPKVTRFTISREKL